MRLQIYAFLQGAAGYGGKRTEKDQAGALSHDYFCEKINVHKNAAFDKKELSLW